MDALKERVFFSGRDLPTGVVLEGVLGWPRKTDQSGGATSGSSLAQPHVCEEGPGEIVGGVVIAHPHPLHGATMEQIVVRHVSRSCERRVFVSLRFNFRGVGQSGGHYSGVEEHRDVEAAVAFLADKIAGGRASSGGAYDGALPVLGLAGYSFGSVMAARAAASKADLVRALALITFPVCWDQLPADTLQRLALYPGPILALCAEYDDIAPPEEVDKVLAKLGVDYRLEVIGGVGHFLEGKEELVGEKVAGFFADLLCPGNVKLKSEA